MSRSRAHFPDMLLVRVERLRRGMDDLAPIMPDLERELWEDNERGLLRGTDRFDRPLAPLAESTLRTRKGTGPPLVPRYRQSRMIAHYRVTHFRRSAGVWTLLGAWQDVLSKKGVPFAGFHFEGRGYLPQRDLRGVRREGKRRMQALVADFVSGRLQTA